MSHCSNTNGNERQRRVSIPINAMGMLRQSVGYFKSFSGRHSITRGYETAQFEMPMVGINIKDAKAGINQFTLIKDQEIIAFLSCLLKRGSPPEERAHRKGYLKKNTLFSCLLLSKKQLSFNYPSA